MFVRLQKSSLASKVVLALKKNGVEQQGMNELMGQSAKFQSAYLINSNKQQKPNTCHT